MTVCFKQMFKPEGFGRLNSIVTTIFFVVAFLFSVRSSFFRLNKKFRHHRLGMASTHTPEFPLPDFPDILKKYTSISEDKFADNFSHKLYIQGVDCLEKMGRFNGMRALSLCAVLIFHLVVCPGYVCDK